MPLLSGCAVVLVALLVGAMASAKPLYPHPTNPLVVDEPVGVLSTDLDGDGNLDLVSSNSNGQNVVVLLGNGDGTFGAETQYGVAEETPLRVAIGDFNDDGHQDLISPNISFGSTTMRCRCRRGRNPGHDQRGSGPATEHGREHDPVEEERPDQRESLEEPDAHPLGWRCSRQRVGESQSQQPEVESAARPRWVAQRPPAEDRGEQ